MMKFNGFLTIIYKERIQEDVFQIRVTRSESVGSILPGQFFNITTTKIGYPLLRRPISVSKIGDDYIEFTIKVVGTGTQALMAFEVGDSIEMMGPLGNGFDLKCLEGKHKKNVLLVGGGIGVAPIKGLMEHLVSEGHTLDTILGFRDDPYLEDGFLSQCSSCTIVSEHASNYKQGYVTEPFVEAIDEKNYDMIFACGPEVMLKTLAQKANSKGVPIQLLMEEKMACGIGACLVCTCKQRDGEFGHKHVRMCKDGPMFYGSEVMFDEA